MLRIANVTHDLKYDICVNLLFEDDFKEVSRLNKLCCHIVIEEPEQEVISFNLELIMIGFLVIFYFLIIFMSWKCPHQRKIEEIFKSIPPERVAALTQLSVRRPEELRRRTMRLRGVSNATIDTEDLSMDQSENNYDSIQIIVDASGETNNSGTIVSSVDVVDSSPVPVRSKRRQTA